MIWIASFPKSQTVGFGKRCYSDNFFAKILTVTSGFQWTSCTEPPHVCFSCFLCLKTRFYLLKLFLRMLKCCFCCEYPETLTSSYCSSASRCSVFGWAVPLKSHKKDVATSKQLSPLSRTQTLESLFECVELAVSSMSNKSGKLQIINEVLEIKKKKNPAQFLWWSSLMFSEWQTDRYAGNMNAAGERPATGCNCSEMNTQCEAAALQPLATKRQTGW